MDFLRVCFVGVALRCVVVVSLCFVVVLMR